MRKILLMGIVMLFLLPLVQGYTSDIVIHNKTLIIATTTNSSSILAAPDEVIFLTHCNSAGAAFDRTDMTGVCTGAASFTNETNGTGGSINNVKMFQHDKAAVGWGGQTGTLGTDWTRYVFKDDDFQLSNGTFFRPNEKDAALNFTIRWNVSYDITGASAGLDTNFFMFNFTGSKWVACSGRSQAVRFGVGCGANSNITDTYNFFNSTNHSLLLIQEHVSSGNYGLDHAHVELRLEDFTINNEATQCQAGPIDTTNQKVALGFNFFEEINSTDINTADGDAFFQFYTGNNFTTVNLTVTDFSDLSQLTVCIQPLNETWIVNGTVEYEDSGHRLNDYYLNNFSIASGAGNTENVSLYMLRDGDGTGITLTLTDQLDEPVVNHVIFIQRYDVNTDTFRTVSMGKTDSSGEDFIYMQQNDAWYRFLINDPYLNRKLTTAIQRVTTTALAFRIFPTPFSETLENIAGVIVNMTYDDSDGSFTASFNDPSGKMVTGCLRIDHFGSGLNITTESRQCTTSSSGTLSYITANTTGTYIAKFEKIFPAQSPNPLEIITLTVEIGRDIVEQLGIGLDGPAIHYLVGVGLIGIGIVIHPFFAIALYLTWFIFSISVGFLAIDLSLAMSLLLVVLIIVFWIARARR